MPEMTRRARARAQDTSSEVEDVADGGREEQSNHGGATITSELKETFREAAIEVLKPVARKATTAAAKYAVTQGPSVVKDKLAGAGGAGGLAKGVGGVAARARPRGKSKGKGPGGP